MKKHSILIFMTLFLFAGFIACKKEVNVAEIQENLPFKELNQKEAATVVKFEHASFVLQHLFSTNPAIRKEFNGFIAAKLKKSGTDEELSFKEIFEAKSLTLPGVQPDFLVRFRKAFGEIFVDGSFPQSIQYKHLNFGTIDDVARYFDVRPSAAVAAPNSPDGPVNPNDGVPYEIYFPYSENWSPDDVINYAFTHDPLTTNEWNYGMFYDALGNPLYEVSINDDYAFGTPTYIITYDDGLKLSDFDNGNMPIEAKNYAINLADDEYNPIVIRSDNTLDDPPTSCSTELRAGQGRWTLLNNGYGIFEGRIELAVSVSEDISAISTPTQNAQNYYSILIDRNSTAFGYVKIKRKRVKEMQGNENSFVHIGVYVSPWCAGQPDKSLVLYEYDKPNFLSQNATEISNFFAGAAGLIGNPATRATISALGVAPLVKVILEGTAQSKVEHFSIVGSQAVISNQRNPTNGAFPSLINGFRPYGTNAVATTLVVD